MISERVYNLNLQQEKRISFGIFFILLYCSFVLSQTPPASEGPAFSEPISNVTVPVGREAILVCVVENLSVYKVAWLRVNTQTILTMASHVITKNHRIGVTQTDHRTWYLHIRDVRAADRGDYMCQINTDPMKSQIGYLDVVVPPDILDYPTSTDIVVKEGSNVTLRCAASGSPAPNIIWRRESGDRIHVGSNEVAHVEGPVFNITKVNRLHMGPYLCIASNGIPPTVSKRIMLAVHFPPMIWIQNQLVGVEIGQQITLECLSEAYPKSINYWMKENNEIISNGDKYEPLLVDNAYNITMKLTIKEVNMEDFQTYKCVSKNPLGFTDGAINLYHSPLPTTQSITTTTTTTTTTIALKVVTRTERKQRMRQKPIPTVLPSSNEVSELQAAAKSRDRGLQLRGSPNDQSPNNAREKISGGLGGGLRLDNSGPSIASNNLFFLFTKKYSVQMALVTLLSVLS